MIVCHNPTAFKVFLIRNLIERLALDEMFVFFNGESTSDCVAIKIDDVRQDDLIEVFSLDVMLIVITIWIKTAETRTSSVQIGDAQAYTKLSVQILKASCSQSVVVLQDVEAEGLARVVRVTNVSEQCWQTGVFLYAVIPCGEKTSKFVLLVGDMCRRRQLGGRRQNEVVLEHQSVTRAQGGKLDSGVVVPGSQYQLGELLNRF